MNRAVTLAANGLLLVLCCWLAAGAIADVAGAVLAPPPAVSAAPPPTAPAGARPWEERRVILDRNLFNVSTLVPAEAVAVEEQEQYEKTRLPLTLLGTAAANDPQFSWAAVEDQEERSHLVVRVDDQLKGRATVVRIERRRIVLRNGPRLEELALEENTGAAPPARAAARRNPRRTAGRTPSRPPSRREVDVRKTGEDQFSVDRAGVQDVARNPSQLFSQARILPKYEEGEMVGVQLNAIQSGSLFEQIGIQNGDVITEFNGIQVTGQQESAQVLQQLSTEEAFNLTVCNKSGDCKPLSYELR